jgi:anthranilate phosphoribosyltransferase
MSIFNENLSAIDVPLRFSSAMLGCYNARESQNVGAADDLAYGSNCTTMTADLKSLLAAVAAGGRLSESEAEAAFDIIMSGDATPSQMGGFLMALRVRGETVDEITGAARIMRAKALQIDAPPGAIDTCGTGGDASGSFNISTASAIVVAGCGVPVAKHGNRALSSKSGSADVLTALGVNIDADLTVVRACLWEIGLGFLMAPRHHAATRHVAPTRVELGTRTIFNLLGPLSSPALARRQLVGVFAPEWVRPMAEVLGRLGGERAWVVHGDGLDELTTTGVTIVASLENGQVDTFEITAADAGLPAGQLDALRGGEPLLNARLMRDLLDGVGGPLRDVVLLNSAAALLVAGRATNLYDGVELAARAIDNGAARRVLQALVARSNAPPMAAAETVK